MPKTAKKIVLVVAAFMVVVFAVFLFNQTTQIVQSARAVNIVFGNGVMWGLIFTYCILLTTPLVLWFRLPKRMLPPEATEGTAAYDRFLADFKKRLSRHPRLRGHALNSTTDIESALQKLDKHADDVVTSTASAVFLSTAVLQSGRLDVLVVFAAQTRLIWQVAHVYYQRPSLRDFVQLYANVASTAFIAAGIEDIDVDVLVGTVFGSTVAAIPGMHLLASSVLSGSANAFLTLRVGMITKEYCRCTVRVEKAGLRRAATVKAAKLLGSIVREGTVKLSKATVSASKTKLSQAFDRVIRRRGTVEISRKLLSVGRVTADRGTLIRTSLVSNRAWLEELGTPISVQQRAMRHGDIGVIMNVYGDPVNDALRDASSKVAERAISQFLTKSVS